MTWTYASSNVGTSGLSTVRFRVGDTTTSWQLLQDEEITGMLTLYGNPTRAAAECALAIAAQYARQADKAVGHLRIANSQSAIAYERMAKRLLMEVGLGVAPYAGGISVADKTAVNADSDRVRPAFRVGLHDFPVAAIADTTS